MIRLALAQQDFLVGDIPGNLRKARDSIEAARAGAARVVLFPELTLTGYPPEDLLLRPGFMRQAHEALDALVKAVAGIDVVIGHPWMVGGDRYNAVTWARDGVVVGRYFKQLLPNYAVFDEARYFTAGEEPLVVDVDGCRFGVLICEDAWAPGPAARAKAAGAEALLIPNASPYRDDKQSARDAIFARRCEDTQLPMVYCNLVGGQDELVFDGRSVLIAGDGRRQGQGPLCAESLLFADFDPQGGQFFPEDWTGPPREHAEELYEVLVTGLRDYVRKNGFREVVFGLSGGIDSALTLALAVDALGSEHVHCVMMPSRFTSQQSLGLAREQAELLGVDYRTISIERAFEALLGDLAPSFKGVEEDVTEENLQARIRGNIIMALSNKFGWLPLATSNKSELAVGYSTIYGDMCGGFSPLKDALKTRVYELCRWRNLRSPAIPQAVIDRAPSAELRPDQIDQDSLPPYEVLDEVLHRFVDRDWSIQRIVDEGFEEAMVRRVAGLVLINEYKRRQGAPGTRITSRGFGRDRRYPITSGWRERC
ncbi:MAG: NAD+ synthase [Pseudomonadota bacterium]